MRRSAIVLCVIAAAASIGCGPSSGRDGCGSLVPGVIEMGRRYDLMFPRAPEVMSVRIEGIDRSAGWIRVRRVDTHVVSWVNMANVERVRAAD